MCSLKFKIVDENINMSYAKLNIACPGRNCPRRIQPDGNNWKHCSVGNVEINEFCNVRCTECGYSKNIYSWGFDCGHHPTSDRLQLPTIDTLAAAFSMACKFAGNMSVIWFRTLITNLLETDPRD
ncbi:hypothetical protein SteCoe_2887 [Stentor coeruleus]|uniref:Uncharacterized protein n=1 Tax=Stentor coeruleus TaxID=5963 RepID=A0A1R2CYB8_9CILI|nr:hypothetical protein SteCoe_2887 [Stentor coeruleus]